METTTRDRAELRVPPPRQAASGPFRVEYAKQLASAVTAPSRPAPRPPAPRRPATRRPAPAPADARLTIRPAQVRAAALAGQKAGATVPRMRFALLVLVLLGGGLVCLLVINTTLGATSFRISQLQSQSATLTSQQQALQQQIAAELSPALIARRAYALGMRVESNGNILDLRTHRFDKLASQPGATVPLGAAGSAATGGSGQ